LNTQHYDLLIIGAGPSGLTAALYGHRAGLNVHVLGGETPGGQVMLHYKVENYPAFPGGVTGAELMARWLQQVIDEVGSFPEPESVTAVNLTGNIKEIFVGDRVYQARAVIVATGARPRKLSVPGESKLEGKGVFYCATCDAPLLRTMASRRAAVVGGGDTAFHTAMALLPHAESVTVITRAAEPRAKRPLVSRLEQAPGASVLVRRSVNAVVGEKGVSGLILQNTETNQTETFPVDAVFVGVGQVPVTGFLTGSVELNEGGFVVTDGLLQTSVAGVFAAGDVRNTPLRQIITAAADGALAAHSAMEYLQMQP
jgi:thioredoxin reductase (NADPH)